MDLGKLLVPSSLRQALLPHGAQKLALLGATGSIGTSTLDIVRMFPGKFSVDCLVVNRSVQALDKLILEFHPTCVGICDETAANQFSARARELGVKLAVGPTECAAIAAESAADTVVAAIVGEAGVLSVISALLAGKRVALANKESLVVAGHYIAQSLREGKAEIIPVDSEHSAIFQCLHGVEAASVAGVTLTASGGPFLSRSVQSLRAVTPAEAVKHPRWSMGPKISVDSATLMNKALEIIEAAWLFGLDESEIKVVIHPQSIIHSFLDFIDGAQLAQLSVPDMKGAIAYALSYPGKRLPNLLPTLDFSKLSSLEFSAPDADRFPALTLARSSLRRGGTASAVLNIANEVAVEEFLAGRLPFDRIAPLVESSLARFSYSMPASVHTLVEFCQQLRTEVKSNLPALLA